MKDVAQLLTDYEPLIKHTVSQFTRNVDSSRYINHFEDFMQEGRIAALKAIRSFEDGFDAKLSTYIVRCIRNKMQDLHRRAAANKHAQLDYVDPDEVTEMVEAQSDSERSVYDDIDTFCSLDKYLSSRQFKMVQKIIEEDDCSFHDLVKFAEKQSGNRHKCRNEALACLSLVQQALQLNVKIPKRLIGKKQRRLLRVATG